MRLGTEMRLVPLEADSGRGDTGEAPVPARFSGIVGWGARTPSQTPFSLLKTLAFLTDFCDVATSVYYRSALGGTQGASQQYSEKELTMPSASDNKDLSWEDPVGIFVLLKEAIQELIRGKGSYDERMEGATNAFFRLPSERFPEALRDQVERLHSVRLRARLEYGEHVLFRFRPITPKQRDAFAKDMLDVFTACAMCVARLGEDYLDPARSTEDFS